MLDADGADAVEVLASHGDGSDFVDERLAVMVYGGCEGGEFVVEDDVACGAPEAEEEGRVSVEGGLDGGDGGVGGAALDCGVETGTGEAGGSS